MSRVCVFIFLAWWVERLNRLVRHARVCEAYGCVGRGEEKVLSVIGKCDARVMQTNTRVSKRLIVR
jgi:hypothetical protein